MESEITPQSPPQPSGNPEVALLREVSKPLFDMAPWLKFIGIAGIVMIGITIAIILVAGIVTLFMAVGSRFPTESIFMWISFLVALIPMALTIWLYLLLFKAGKQASPAYLNADKSAMISSLNNLKIYFIITGILTIIGLVFAIGYICVAALMIPVWASFT